jgi:hypothetical protein
VLWKTKSAQQCFQESAAYPLPLKEIAYQGTWLLLVRGAVGVLIAPATTLLVGSLFPPVEAVGLVFALCFPAIPKVRLVLGGRLSLYGAIWLDGKIL